MKTLIQKAKNNKMMKNLAAITKIELKYIDVFKDLGLSILMLNLIGGPRTIIKFPATFCSAVVICMFASIFIQVLSPTNNYIERKTVHQKKISLPERRLRKGYFVCRHYFVPAEG